MNNHAQWLALDTSQLYKPKHKSLNGVKVNLFLPPSLIPNAIRGEFDITINKFVIEFRYMAPLSLDSIQTVSSDDQVVTLHFDRASSRVQKILIDVNIANAKHIHLNLAAQVTNSIKSAEKKVDEIDEKWLKEGIEVATAAMNLKKNDLFGGAQLR